MISQLSRAAKEVVNSEENVWKIRGDTQQANYAVDSWTEYHCWFLW